MIGGGANGTALPPLTPRSCGCEPRDDCVGRLGGSCALLEILQRDDHEAGVRLGVIVDEVQSDDRVYVGDRAFLLEDILGLPHHLRCAPDRGAVGQLDDDEECALIVGREEAGRRHPRKQPNAGKRRHNDDDPDDCKPNQPRNRRAVAVADPVDSPLNHPHRAALRSVMRLQQDRAESRRQASAR